MRNRRHITGDADLHGQGQTRRQFPKATGLAAFSASTAPQALLTGGDDNNPLLEPRSNASDHGGPQSTKAKSHQELFSSAAKWVWDSTDRRAYHHYIQARKRFTLKASELRRISGGAAATLRITADAY